MGAGERAATMAARAAARSTCQLSSVPLPSHAEYQAGQRRARPTGWAASTPSSGASKSTVPASIVHTRLDGLVCASWW